MAITNPPVGGIIDFVNQARQQQWQSILPYLPFPFNPYAGLGGANGNPVGNKRPQTVSNPIQMKVTPPVTEFKYGPIPEGQPAFPNSPTGTIFEPGQLDDPLTKKWKQRAPILEKQRIMKENRAKINPKDFMVQPDQRVLPWAMVGAALIQALSGGQSGANALTGFMQGYKQRTKYEGENAWKRYQNEIDKADKAIGDAQEEETRFNQDWAIEDRYKSQPEEKAAEPPPGIVLKLPHDSKTSKESVNRSIASSANLSPKFLGRVVDHAQDFDVQVTPLLASDWGVIQRLVNSKERKWTDTDPVQVSREWKAFHDVWASGQDGYSIQSRKLEAEASNLNGQIETFERQLDRLSPDNSTQARTHLTDLYPEYEQAVARLNKITGSGGLLERLAGYRKQLKDAIAYFQPPSSRASLPVKRNRINRGRRGG